MANNYRRVEDTIDGEGFIVTGYGAWDCEKCGKEVRRYRGQPDMVNCYECGAVYNSGGQRLRDDARGNPSNYDENISDLDGYEMQHAGDE